MGGTPPEHSGPGPCTGNSFEFMAKKKKKQREGGLELSLFGRYLRETQFSASQPQQVGPNPAALRPQIIRTFRIVANWRSVEGPVSCLSVPSPSFCVLSFQSAGTDCNLANQVSGFVERATMGRRAGGRSFISAELPGLIGAGERNTADDGTTVPTGRVWQMRRQIWAEENALNVRL